MRHRKNAKRRPIRRSTRTIARYPCGVGATAPPDVVGAAAAWACCWVGAAAAPVVPVALGCWVTAGGVLAAPLVPVVPAPVAVPVPEVAVDVCGAGVVACGGAATVPAGD